MDSIDFKILENLLENGRMTWTELASQLNLSIPAITERVKKLDEQGIIKGYAAKINFQQLGFTMTAIVFVTLSHPQHRKEFIQHIKALPEVLECAHVTGDDDYMLKVICLHSEHLDHVLSERIKSISGVIKTKTMIILSTQKDSITLIPEVIKK